MMDNAGSEAKATSRCSVPVWAMESAVRSMVSPGVREGEQSQQSNHSVVFLTGISWHRKTSLSANDFHPNHPSLLDPQSYLLPFVLLFPLLSVQRPGTRCMVATPTASHVHFHSSSWERRTTPARQMDVQMDSSGAPQRQTTRKISNTLSVLRRLVRHRSRNVNMELTVKLGLWIQWADVTFIQ